MILDGPKGTEGTTQIRDANKQTKEDINKSSRNTHTHSFGYSFVFNIKFPSYTVVAGPKVRAAHFGRGLGHRRHCGKFGAVSGCSCSDNRHTQCKQ